MNRDDAKEKFKEADRLFNEREYARALELLTELDRAYPNQRAVLYPMARCLAGLRRLSEAMDLADRIVRDFEYAPAQELKERLQDKHARISSIPPHSTSSFDPPGDTPKPSKPPVVPRDEDIASFPQNPEILTHDEAPPTTPRRVAVLVCLGLVLLSYGVYAGVGATVAKPALTIPAEIHDQYATTEAPWREIMFLWVGHVAHLYVLACLPMYAALKSAGASRFNSFAPDMKDAATYTLYGFLLAPIVLLGWIVFFYVVKRGFEISNRQAAKTLGIFLILFGVLYTVDWAILTFALHPVLAG